METHVVFMGSPEFALPILRALANCYTVVGVVTQPDRPAGRGRILTSPPIKCLADELDLPTIQPSRLSAPEAFQQLQAWAPDLIVVAAFGQILRPAVLDLPKYGCVNVHASLLPRWRGAAPIQAAILHGDDLTGATIMRMDPGVDTGPILSQKTISITNQDTAGYLSVRLSLLGAELLLETLPGYLSSKITPRSQDESLATYAPMVKKADGLLDFARPSAELARQVHAYNPWPGAFMYWNGQVLKIHRAHIALAPASAWGRQTIHQGSPAMTSADGLLVLDELQVSGRKAQSGVDFLRGARNWAS
jgi:methionyl-tRNA formyltransferase